MNDFASMSGTDRLRLAGDPTVPPERLEALYTWCDVAGRRHYVMQEEHAELLDALAANPSLPPLPLFWMAYLAPAGFCRNPTAPLLPLESPEMVDRMVRNYPAELLRCQDAPASIVTLLATQGREPYLHIEARLHVALTDDGADDNAPWLEETMDALVRFFWERMRPEARRQFDELRSIAGNRLIDFDLPAPAEPVLPCEWSEEARVGALASILRRPYERITRTLALSALAPSQRELLVEHAVSDDWFSRLGVVLNPHLVTADPEDSRELLALLADDGNRLVRAGARAQQAGAYRAH